MLSPNSTTPLSLLITLYITKKLWTVENRCYFTWLIIKSNNIFKVRELLQETPCAVAKVKLSAKESRNKVCEEAFCSTSSRFCPLSLSSYHYICCWVSRVFSSGFDYINKSIHTEFSTQYPEKPLGFLVQMVAALNWPVLTPDSYSLIFLWRLMLLSSTDPGSHALTITNLIPGIENSGTARDKEWSLAAREGMQ